MIIIINENPKIDLFARQTIKTERKPYKVLLNPINDKERNGSHMADSYNKTLKRFLFLV